MLNIPGIQQHTPLAPFTTFKIGGPAEFFVAVKTVDELRVALKVARENGVRVTMLGGGSDVLIADAGVKGLVIKMELREIVFDDEQQQVRAGAGVLMAALIRQCLQHSLTGLEYAIGVPATVGGAVWANLGARGTELSDRLVEVTAIDAEGMVRVMSREECAFAYRDSVFKHEPLVIVDALFQLTVAPQQDIQQAIRSLAALRSDTQDVAAQCAGCVFRNPTDQTDIPAAKLIDDLGLKGKQIGGAQVSDVHANFIINTGTATADDVAQLISYVKQQVRDQAGVQLMEEIEYVGFDS